MKRSLADQSIISHSVQSGKQANGVHSGEKAFSSIDDLFHAFDDLAHRRGVPVMKEVFDVTTLSSEQGSDPMAVILAATEELTALSRDNFGLDDWLDS